MCWWLYQSCRYNPSDVDWMRKFLNHIIQNFLRSAKQVFSLAFHSCCANYFGNFHKTLKRKPFNLNLIKPFLTKRLSYISKSLRWISKKMEFILCLIRNSIEYVLSAFFCWKGHWGYQIRLRACISERDNWTRGKEEYIEYNELILAFLRIRRCRLFKIRAAEWDDFFIGCSLLNQLTISWLYALARKIHFIRDNLLINRD